MFVDFEKAFFPTEEEKRKQKDLVSIIDSQRLQHYIDQGKSIKEAKTLLDQEVKEYMERGYYS